MSTERFKNVTSCFVINLLNNKTIILLSLAEYRLFFADSAFGLVRRLIVKYFRAKMIALVLLSNHSTDNHSKPEKFPFLVSNFIRSKKQDACNATC